MIEYDKVKYLKDRIIEIQSEILEGVKIRSRIEEQLEGERVSSFLIKKQAEVKKRQYITKIKSESNILDNLEEGIILDNKDIIELYICNYYKKLYTDEPYDESLQTEFLELINTSKFIITGCNILLCFGK